MSKINKSIIIEKATEIFAHGGLGEFRIRLLAKRLDVSPSVIYHHFTDENAVLKEMFDSTNIELGRLRRLPPVPKTASKMLKQRIEFQLDNAEKIVAILKYYLAFRKTFPKNKDGFVPDNSSLHMEEVLEYGKGTGEYTVKNIKDDAKVMTHAVNGFLLEYYPYKIEGKEKVNLIRKIYSFLNRILKGGEYK